MSGVAWDLGWANTMPLVEGVSSSQAETSLANPYEPAVPLDLARLVAVYLAK